MFMFKLGISECGSTSTPRFLDYLRRSSMFQLRNWIKRISLSELRGIGLVILGLMALGFYYAWWFVEGRLSSPWLVLGFIGALLCGMFQILAGWVVYLWIHRRPVVPTRSPHDLTVDVFVTAYNEEYTLVEQNLAASCAMNGPHRTWLLDDRRDPALARLAERLGAGYLTRSDHNDAKAGNVNAALAHTDGDIIVIFDTDHIPQPNFLQQTLGCFADPKVGFVQVMPTFSNNRQGWVARAAIETSLDFYNATSKGMDGFQSVTKMGSNSLIRRSALASIGGYQPGLAEDLATSIALHAAGWRSRYVAEPLAPGLAPPDLSAWFTQQFKWARGVFEVLLTTYPRVFGCLKWGQRLSYAVRTTNYLVGPIIFVHLAVTIAVLFGGDQAAQTSLQQYFIHLTPLAFLEMIIRSLALRRWRHASAPTESLWRAFILIYVSWPVYTLAWIMAVLRLPLSFRPTPKSSNGGVNPLWLLPQLISLLLLVSGIIYAVINTAEPGSFLILYSFATCLAIPQLGIFRPLLRPILFRNQGVSKSDVRSPESGTKGGQFWS
jgi:cellulose synthase (UDP-forming)